MELTRDQKELRRRIPSELLVLCFVLLIATNLAVYKSSSGVYVSDLVWTVTVMPQYVILVYSVSGHPSY